MATPFYNNNFLPPPAQDWRAGEVDGKPQRCEPKTAAEATSGGAAEMEAANTLADLADGVDEVQEEDGAASASATSELQCSICFFAAPLLYSDLPCVKCPRRNSRPRRFPRGNF